MINLHSPTLLTLKHRNRQQIQQISVQHNAVLPSSAPVERLFSFAGMITHPRRLSLSDKG